MKKITKVIVLMSTVLVFSACGQSPKNENTSKTTETTQQGKAQAQPTSSISNEYLSDLSTEINQYWYADGAYKGKNLTDLNEIPWKTSNKTEVFSMRSDDEALFATLDNGNIVNARIFKVGKIDKNGFFALTQTKSIVSDSYLNEKVKEAARKSYTKVNKANISPVVPNEQYWVSTKHISKKVRYMRFYKVSDMIYREDYSGTESVIFHRYSK